MSKITVSVNGDNTSKNTPATVLSSNKSVLMQTVDKLKKEIPLKALSVRSGLNGFVKPPKFVTHHQQHKVIKIMSNHNGKVTQRIINRNEYVDNSDVSIVQAEQVVGLDLMNFRVIRCDGSDVAQEVTAIDEEVDVGDVVVQMSDDGQETQYVLAHHTTEISEDGTTSIVIPADQNDSHMNQYMHVVEQDSVPLVFFTDKSNNVQHLQQQQQQLQQEQNEEFLDKSKRRRKKEFILSDEMIGSPKFKLYLYSCKLCDFKCNAIKELTVHRSNKHHSGNVGRYRNTVRPPVTSIVHQVTPTETISADVIYGVNMNYCSVCSYSSISSQQVKRHINKIHRASSEDMEENEEGREMKNNRLGKLYERASSNSVNHLSVNYYFCEDCGFGSSSKHSYKRHQCSRSSNKFNLN